MQQIKDEGYLAEIFSRAARIPRAKIDAAIEDNSILDVINHPHLIRTATPAEIQRVEDLLSFREQYEAVSSADKLKYQIHEMKDAYNYLAPEMANLETERMDMLILNARCRVIKRETLGTGNLSGCAVAMQHIVRAAVLYNASAVILAHNHPSGETSPSAADVDTTERIQEALRLVHVKLIDHLIIGAHGYTSLRETGKMEGKQYQGTSFHAPQQRKGGRRI